MDLDILPAPAVVIDLDVRLFPAVVIDLNVRLATTAATPGAAAAALA